jgi:transcriptional regulator with XRE-family HTH domain
MARQGYTTIGQLSDVTGINRNTLSDILNGESYPSGIVMQKIVKALELGPEAAGRIFFVPALASDASICE